MCNPDVGIGILTSAHYFPFPLGSHIGNTVN